MDARVIANGKREYLALATLAAVAALACPQPIPFKGTPVAVVSTELPVCPDHNSGIPPIHPDSTDSLLPLARRITQVPEFHDCQRLISARNVKLYGTLAGVWVAEDLNDRVGKLFTSPTLDPDSLVDSIPGPLGKAPGGAPRRWVKTARLNSGTALALVYAWDGNYGPLGIARGWNCLYVVRSLAPSGVTAAMIPVPGAEVCVKMDQLTTLAREATVLNVYTYSDSQFRREDYPPVGRWEWDGRQQAIGLGCGDRWCMVSALGSIAPSVGYSIGTGSRKAQRVYAIRGWYDEQRLAIAPPNPTLAAAAGPASLVPAAFGGTVIPDPRLDDVTDTAVFKNVWVHVASVALETEDSGYSRKLNFHHARMPHGTPPAGLTEVFLCREGPGDNDDCDPAPRCPDTEWHAKIVPPADPKLQAPTVYRCVTRTDHSQIAQAGFHIPGTARWQWENSDETLWTQCAEGCCKVR